MEVVRLALREPSAKIALARLCLRGETAVTETEKAYVTALLASEETGRE